MSQLARRENAPHRAAFVASPSRWRIHSVRDNAPPFHPCLCGEEAPFLFLAERIHYSHAPAKSRRREDDAGHVRNAETIGSSGAVGSPRMPPECLALAPAPFAGRGMTRAGDRLSLLPGERRPADSFPHCPRRGARRRPECRPGREPRQGQSRGRAKAGSQPRQYSCPHGRNGR